VAPLTVVSLPDERLVALARAGDKEAFGALVDRHSPMAAALVSRLLAGAIREQIRDIVQEAAVTALVGLHRLRSPERFGAWFASIALNVGRRWLRESLPVVAADFDTPDAGPGPEAVVVAADLAARVRQTVDTLAPGQRAAVLAFYYQGMSHAEAAAELGVSPGAVKARLHQARMALAPAVDASFGRHAPDDLAKRNQEVPSMSSTDTAWIEARVAEVRRSADPDPLRRFHAAILEVGHGARRFPIYLGMSEATALAFNLEAVDAPRPMTYATAANLVAAAGARVSDVRITKLSASTFYALVRIETAAGFEEVDARPSDALNLALVCGAPVLVDPQIFSAPEDDWGRAWEDYPAGAADLVAEGASLQADLMAAAREGPHVLRGGSSPAA
jgi:RNA polymerase sigma factor (sigma-70 family)